MSGDTTLHLIVGSGLPTSASITAAYSAGVPVVLTNTSFYNLRQELGGLEAAIKWLARLVENGSRPVGVNVSEGSKSRTFFIPPKDWTKERLAGHIATMAPVLEEAFGEIDPGAAR